VLLRTRPLTLRYQGHRGWEPQDGKDHVAAVLLELRAKMWKLYESRFPEIGAWNNKYLAIPT